MNSCGSRERRTIQYGKSGKKQLAARWHADDGSRRRCYQRQLYSDRPEHDDSDYSLGTIGSGTPDPDFDFVYDQISHRETKVTNVTLTCTKNELDQYEYIEMLDPNMKDPMFGVLWRQITRWTCASAIVGIFWFLDNGAKLKDLLPEFS